MAMNDEEEIMSEEEEKEAEEEIERELADVTLGDLQKARSNGSHSVYIKPNFEEKASRANKNRPMEVSSKRPVPRHREVVHVPNKKRCDPRFESLCGTFDEDRFKKRFDFFFEKSLPAERKELQEQLSNLNDPKAIDDIKNKISEINKQMKYGIRKNADAQILSEHKKREREATNKGKQPFYLKKSEIRKQELVGKFNELKKTGKLDAFIEKKRRKNATKDRRFMPYRRSEYSGQSSK